MGFTYMGPVDGHDVETLTQMLVLARDMRRPVLLHVHTVKGKGYPYAQQEPGKYHGVGPFDVETGKPLKPSGESFSTVFGHELLDLAQKDDRICAVTAAMVDGTGLTEFAHALPRRFSMWALPRATGWPCAPVWPSRAWCRCLQCIPASCSGVMTCCCTMWR